MSKHLFTGSIAGLATFILLSFGLQLAPPHYSLISQAVSDLAVGPLGAVMAVGFFLNGVSLAAFVIGLILAVRPRPKVGLLFLGAWATASLFIGFFPTELVDAHGFPGSAAAFANSTTLHGRVHLILAAISFFGLVFGITAATFALRREQKLGLVWPWMAGLSVLALAGFVLVEPLGLRGYFGLAERGLTLTGYAWVILVADRLRRTLPRSAAVRQA